jgi:hypothetical protein
MPADPFLILRAAENYQGVALMVRDPMLMRLAAAWPQVRRQLPPLENGEVDLEALWPKTKIDFHHWAELSQLSMLQVLKGWKVLKGNGLILPDGSLIHLADNVLKKEAAGELLGSFGLKPGDLKR